MLCDPYYWNADVEPDVAEYNIIDPNTGWCYPFIKSVDTNIGIVEQVLTDGIMSNGRPRPRVLWGKVVTRSRIMDFDIVEKSSGKVVAKVRR